MIKSDLQRSDAHLTSTADVGRRIRNDIVAGQLGLGDRITIDALSTRYQVSHMPVREALRDMDLEERLMREATPWEYMSNTTFCTSINLIWPRGCGPGVRDICFRKFFTSSRGNGPDAICF